MMRGYTLLAHQRKVWYPNRQKSTSELCTSEEEHVERSSKYRQNPKEKKGAVFAQVFFHSLRLSVIIIIIIIFCSFMGFGHIMDYGDLSQARGRCSFAVVALALA